jgi:hypothetical protein
MRHLSRPSTSQDDFSPSLGCALHLWKNAQVSFRHKIPFFQYSCFACLPHGTAVLQNDSQANAPQKISRSFGLSLESLMGLVKGSMGWVGCANREGLGDRQGPRDDPA